jgi:hypothetical protein
MTVHEDRNVSTEHAEETTSATRKPYTTPQLQEYGRLVELTHSLTPDTPGDPGGGSFAT